MTKKIYFVSDAHLGFPNLKDGHERELKFARWLDSINPDVDELYLLGDIFDFWFDYKHVVPRGFTRILGRIAQLTDRGISVHYFVGNHDLWVRDYFTTELGVKIYREPVATQINEKSFYLAHGDGLGSGDRGYKLLKILFTSRVLHWLFSRLHPNFAFGFAHAWSNNSRYSKGIVAKTIDQKDDILLNHAKNIEQQQHFDYYIFGHRHHPVNIEFGSKASRFVNLGDWLTHFTYAVFDGNELKLMKFEEEETLC